MMTARPIRSRLTGSAPAAPTQLVLRRHVSTTTTSAAAAASSAAPSAGGGGKKRLVVLGTGWGGYAFLKSLSYPTLRQFDVKVVSPTTSFSFTPLLAQASCATLDFRSAIEPIHSNRWMECHHAWCDAVDLANHRIELTPASNPQFRLQDPLLPPAGSSTTTETETEAAAGDSASARSGGTYSLEYDYLVMSVGSYNATFGTQGVKEHALFLKDVSDARAIRWRILGCFERANALHHRFTTDGDAQLTPQQETTLRDLLSFVVVGGGPTGSEFAAELHDLIKDDLSRLYPNLRRYPRIRLLDAGSTILSSFDRGLADYAMKKFARDGIDVQLNAKIAAVQPDGLTLAGQGGAGEERVPAGMVVWSTGITTSPLIEALRGVGKDKRSGKVLTSDTLNLLVDKHSKNTAKLGGSVLQPETYTIPGGETEAETEGSELVQLPNVFAIGDCATQPTKPLPATAQVAAQKGSYLANLFNSHITPSLSHPSSADDREQSETAALHTAKPFQFHDKGSMASIGGAQALIDSPVKKESGALAWILWRSAYTIMSMSWRNRFLVPANWASNLLFGRDVGRF